jgi:hypothetical protein
MSIDDKIKLNDIEEGANKVDVVDSLESTSSISALSAAQGKILDDKIKAIAELNTENYILPKAGDALGGVMTGGDVVIDDGLISVNDNSHNHIISNVDGLQTALDNKSDVLHTHDGLMSPEDKVKLSEMSNIYVGDEADIDTTLLNADTLGGHPASYFAKAGEIPTGIIPQVVLSQSEYDALEIKDSHTLYYIYEEI